MTADRFTLDTPLDQLVFTVLDTETTGLYPEDGHEMIELGMARCAGGKILGTFETLLKPSHALSAEALAVHKITPGRLAAAPSLADRIADILAFIGDSVLAAHNVKFDMTFLHTALRGLGMPILPNWAIDTITLSQEMWPEMKCHCLMCMAITLELPHQGTHRALEDVFATVDLLEHILDRERERGGRTLGTLKPVRTDFTWGKGEAYRRLEGALGCAIRRGVRVHIFLYDRAGCMFTRQTVEPVRVENSTLFARVPGEREIKEFPFINITKALAEPVPEPSGTPPGSAH